MRSILLAWVFDRLETGIAEVVKKDVAMSMNKRGHESLRNCNARLFSAALEPRE